MMSPLESFEPRRLSLRHCFPSPMPFIHLILRKLNWREGSCWLPEAFFPRARRVLMLFALVCLGCYNKNTTDQMAGEQMFVFHSSGG